MFNRDARGRIRGATTKLEKLPSSGSLSLYSRVKNKRERDGNRRIWVFVVGVQIDKDLENTCHIK